MVKLMNKKIIMICITLGSIFAFILYFLYKKNYEEIIIERVYMLQIGAYENYDNVVKITKNLDNYLIKKEDKYYKIIIGITKNTENLEKLKEIYKDYNIYIKEEDITDEDFLNVLVKFDYLLNETNDEKIIKAILKEVINKYKEI